ncbi:MAG: histidinol-phosphate transaminase [Nitrospiraceae bacterium]|nr:histidinol-phosphate transaminase [Nitrospiraceae bacterium]
MNIGKLVKKEVASLRAYSAKEIACRVKLDANESPYGFETALDAALAVKTNRYPDPEAKALKKVLARDCRVMPENILLGNGSDELICYLIETFGGPVLYPVPTFSMYGIIAQALGEQKVEVPLDAAFDLDGPAMLSAVRRARPKLTFLSSPNNPTGNCFSSERILPLIEATKGLVVVDEAYQPFASERGFLPLLKDYPNLIILRTLSKTGLAALRLGYMIASPDIVEQVNKVRLPFNVNALTQAVAVKALQERKKLKESVNKLVAERDRLYGEMERMARVTPFLSEANFILFRVHDPEAVYDGLLRKGVLVRNMNDAAAGCLRVTVGTPEDNSAFLSALGKVLESTKRRVQ